MMQAMLSDQSMSDKEIAKLSLSDGWSAQQKVDGTRILLDISPYHVHVNNRRGEHSKRAAEVLDVIGDWAYALRKKEMCVVLDGEWVNNTYCLFDLKYFDAYHTEDDPFYVRWANLRAFVSATDNSAVKLLHTAFNEAEKIALIEACIRQSAEGIVFRKNNSPYTDYYSDDIQRIEFKREINAVITRVLSGGKRVELGLVASDQVFNIGMCYASSKRNAIYNVGDAVKVGYSHISSRGDLVRPYMIRKMVDLHPADCTVNQIAGATNSEIVIP